MKGEMHFVKSGLLTTIQDKGRFGMREYGIPLSGAMDQYSANLCNMILGNSNSTPLVEITLQGPEVKFSQSTMICLTGAHLSPKLNGQTIEVNKRINIALGDTLSFGKPTYGVRCYLGVMGGFECDKVLGSFSQYQSVTPESRITEGMTLSYSPNKQLEKSNSRATINEEYFSSNTLEVMAGPDANQLDQNIMDLVVQDWRVTQNDRMGYVLSCASIDFSHSKQILTSPVVPGIVQLTPAGKLIVLMRDAQVTGGYPRVLQLTEQSVSKLAQKRDGEGIEWKMLK